MRGRSNTGRERRDGPVAPGEPPCCPGPVGRRVRLSGRLTLTARSFCATILFVSQAARSPPGGRPASRPCGRTTEMAPAQAPPEESSSAQIVPSPRCTSPGADPPQRPRTDPPAAPQPEGDPLSSRMVKRMLEEGEREVEQFMKGYLSAPKLRQLTAMDDLKDVRYLEMTVDTSSMSLNNFGEMVPSLEQLKLNNSMIRSLRCVLQISPSPNDIP
ncbi:MAG: hypothetical protein BJ554DRAFT_4796 [Olpidium bornovanus]|uniref:Uncharacterized protein n=1 Tax=Olpidium bornovanus TaxID=278681 RepID=A0A8H7ZL58_9FUNG|nr:MAG: hypothetical protein BJ554DRAFT_4796 [Olpidium bornovanus]